MFDYITGTMTRTRTGYSRLATSLVSALAHVVVLAAVAIPALYVSDVLPAPPDMMTFVVNVAAPPPPPPPAESPKRAAVKPSPAKRRPPPSPEPPPQRPVTTPVQAPDEILEETGFEDEVAAFENPTALGGIEGGLAGGVIGGSETGTPPPAPPPPPSPVRVGGNITPPQLTHRVEPEYPSLARRAKIQGIVILEATVDERGRVTDVSTLRSHPLLQNAAVDAVRQWRYQPLVLNGIPTPFVLTVTVSFSTG